MVSTISELQNVPEARSEVSCRREQLAQWVVSVLSGESDHSCDYSDDYDHGNLGENASMPMQAIGSDAGFRKYYRVQTPHRTLVAVDAPPATEDTRTFVDIATRWRAGGVYVPEVFAVDYEQGFMLLEDLGDTPMQVLLQNSVADQYYPELLDTLLIVQKQLPDNLPPYDETLIRFELSLYPQWFLGEFMGFDTKAPNTLNQLTELFAALVPTVLEQPKGTVHRDYHSRNLMLTPDGRIGVIDFQGALYGPLLYDVVSLLRDCYVSWPEEKIDRWFSSFIARHPVLAGYDPERLKIWFDLTGLQRHLKCLGIFSRLWLRDGKSGYLNDIPRTLNYVVSVCQRYPQFRDHAGWLQENVEPFVNARIKQVMEEVSV
ncbi:aminoglycoside phosphotransferase family protein [Endozoicomonas sp. SCSIO W0465]|uniref:aminoglycoside phosphotransferase family protein n=1 Tax=Endozoicomonas sp. SCSIO W0465 TaxID=2918516 RepID=UPI002075D3AD|nr:phosphotransferase [Endozoicomonas sp. SCSIO W0465]USE35595.1 phosphotransferase [Endozoicomonas sp. SCSIO W0465]